MRAGRAAACLFGLVMMGCVMQSTSRTLHWDLRESHARSAISWPAGAGDVLDVANAQIVIDLPAGRRYQASGVDVHVLAVGDQILTIAVKYPRTTLDDGYQQALHMARDWQLRTDELERWRQGVLAGRERGVKDADEPEFVVMAGSAIAGGGPTPYAKTLDSFDDQRPFVLDFELQWT
jgi:hypothetical protein